MEEEIYFPDSFSSSVGRILNEKSISAVLSNVEVFYKSQIEYLADNRYEKQIHLPNNSILNNSPSDDSSPISRLTERNETSKNSLPSESANQSFSSYYFIKQTFNCPMVLIDQLINTMSDMKLKEETEIEVECPKQIEIDSAFETDKSNIITKRDLRLLSYYKAPKPKKSRPSGNVGRPMKQPKPATNPNRKDSPDDTPPIDNARSSAFEVIEISDSDEDDELVRRK